MNNKKNQIFNYRLASSAPSIRAISLAIISIILSGLCGGFVGYAVTDLQCSTSCTTLAGSIGVITAATAAGGVAVVVNLALRAMAEWKVVQLQKDIRERHPVE